MKDLKLRNYVKQHQNKTSTIYENHTKGQHSRGILKDDLTSGILHT